MRGSRSTRTGRAQDFLTCSDKAIPGEMPSTRVTYPQGITTEADCQTNRDAASLFHLNSVAVEYGGNGVPDCRRARLVHI